MHSQEDPFTAEPRSEQERDSITKRIIRLLNTAGLCARPSLYECLDDEMAARYGSWCRCNTCRRGPS
jgi:hypothetical protein